MTTLISTHGGTPPANSRQPSQSRRKHAFTLVEMLVALAISLLLMAAVVSVFANVSGSVANRRSSIEMISQLRHVRNLLQADLAAATCPMIPSQRPEWGHGYLEIIEGPRCDFDPSLWLIDENDDGLPDFSIAGETIDLAASLLPSSDLAQLPGSNSVQPGAVTDGGALGDADDTLMLTVRNDQSPYRGRIPANVVENPPQAPTFLPSPPRAFSEWESVEYSSSIAEIAWFAFENPVESPEFATGEFGEPGMRSIHRRVLLVAPSLDYSFAIPNVNGGTDASGPGVVRVLRNNVEVTEVDEALAALIAFQELYDLSVHLEWRPEWERWAIVANSLRDLTKRENRFEHFGYVGAALPQRFPFAAVSSGAGYSGTTGARYVYDAELVSGNNGTPFSAIAPGGDVAGFAATGDPVAPASVDPTLTPVRPFVEVRPSDAQFATARAVTNRSGVVVGMTTGLAPLGGARRGEDVVMTDVLAFDLKVLDTQAPVVASINVLDGPQQADFPGVVLEPGDRGWGDAVRTGGWRQNGSPVGQAVTVASRGAYVDLGYATLHDSFMRRNGGVAVWGLTAGSDRLLSLIGDSEYALRSELRSGMRMGANLTDPLVFDQYRVYDTWSTHYENNGIDEDGRYGVDQGTNGLDDLVLYTNDAGVGTEAFAIGPDDSGEKETSPPYDTRLRAMQVKVRAYELDSRQIREVTVRQGYVPR
ncbi:MAG: prepilin-type N-terminal cleavage/methylation domain-containing protein [Planctomycetota bacterium]